MTDSDLTPGGVLRVYFIRLMAWCPVPLDLRSGGNRRWPLLRKAPIMATLLRPSRPYALPANPDLVTKDDKPHIRLKERGKPVLYPISRDGKKYLKPSAKWYGQYTDALGVVRRKPLSSNKDAAKLMLAALVRRVEGE